MDNAFVMEEMPNIRVNIFSSIISEEILDFCIKLSFYEIRKVVNCFFCS